MRWLLMLGVLCTGCASMTRATWQTEEDATGDSGPPKQETVYMVPLDEALMMTRRIFEEQRYDVFERSKQNELYTSAHEPGLNRLGNRSWERYFVKGAQVGPRQSIIRVFRLRYAENDYLIEQKPKFIGDRLAEEEKYMSRKTFDRSTFEGVPDMEGFKLVRGVRDLGIERKLLSRLEMVPSLELVGGTASIPVRSVVVDDWKGPSDTEVEPAECQAPLPGAEPLLVKGQTVLLADPMGTRELPEAATRLVCDASAKGLPVVLALSLPASEQPLLEQYLGSAGDANDVEQLLVASSFWRRVYQDGRSSSAVLRLLEQARRLKASGRDVSVVAFDSDSATGNAREAEMEQHLLPRLRQRPEAWALVLAGDVHVRTVRVDWDKDFEPLGARLARASGTTVKALEVGFDRGTQFACRFNVWEKVACDIFALSPNAQASQGPDIPRGVKLFDAPSDKGFHGRVYVGALSASPPVMRRTGHAAAEPVAKQ